MLPLTEKWIIPNWPAPARVRAMTTTRIGGVSQEPYASFNLADHVGDAPAAVAANRAQLRQALDLTQEPLWLQQVHGCTLATTTQNMPGCTADATLAFAAGPACVVLTADCLPVLLCDFMGQRVAAIHAGWRGLCAGIIETTITALGIPGSQLFAWLGPAIGPQAFEVGDEVRAAFLSHNSAAASAFQFTGIRWRADLYALARQRLNAMNVTAISGGEYCTVNDAARFFSYRRDGITGRMASLIWLI